MLAVHYWWFVSFNVEFSLLSRTAMYWVQTSDDIVLVNARFMTKRWKHIFYYVLSVEQQYTWQYLSAAILLG